MKCSLCCTATLDSSSPFRRRFLKFFMETKGVCSNCVAEKQHHNCFVSPLMWKLSAGWVCHVPLWFYCASLEQRSVLFAPLFDFSSEPHEHHSTEIINYHSVMVIALLCFTHHKWKFYINHLSDILWDSWLYSPAILCTVFVASAEQRQEAGVCESERHSTCST